MTLCLLVSVIFKSPWKFTKAYVISFCMRYIILLALLTSSYAHAKFQFEEELALLSTSGNTELQTYDVKSKNTYTFQKESLRLDLFYTYGESESDTNAENWRVLLRYDHTLDEKNDVFLGHLVESDRFAGFSTRYNTDAGWKRFLMKTDTYTAFSEAGLRYVVENKTVTALESEKTTRSRLYLEGLYKFREEMQGKVWAEYIQSFESSDDYLINAEASLAVTLTNTLSLKTSYLYNFNNDPVDAKERVDTKFATSLLAKF